MLHMYIIHAIHIYMYYIYYILTYHISLTHDWYKSLLKTDWMILEKVFKDLF